MNNEKTIGKSISIMIIYIILTSFIFAIFYSITSDDAISYTITYLGMLLFFIIVYKKNLWSELLHLKEDIKGKRLKIIKYFIFFIILMMISNLILYQFFGNVADNEQIARETLFQNPLLMTINIALLGPITEELTYRYPFKYTKGNSFTIFMIYSLIFASVHIASATTFAGILYIIPYFFLSLSFSYGFYKTDNIFVSIILHIFNNFFNIVLLLI